VAERRSRGSIAGPWCNDGNRTIVLRLTDIDGLQIRRLEMWHGIGDGLQIIERRDMLQAEALAQSLSRCPKVDWPPPMRMIETGPPWWRQTRLQDSHA
jgi:hypothetical protein